MQNRERTATRRATSHGVLHPTTLEETSSDLRRTSTSDCAAPSDFVSLLTLYSAHNPSRPISCGKRPWVSAFRGFPFSVAETPHDASFPLSVFRRYSGPGEPGTSQRRRGSRDLSTREVRIDESGVTRSTPTDPLLASHLSEVFTPLDSASCLHEASSLGLSRLAGRRTALRDVCSAEFQRTRGLARLFRGLPTSLRFMSSAVTSREKI
jgi:hypothetical protein